MFLGCRSVCACISAFKQYVHLCMPAGRSISDQLSVNFLILPHDSMLVQYML